MTDSPFDLATADTSSTPPATSGTSTNDEPDYGAPADDARPQDIELYAVLLTFTMQRLDLANELLAKSPRRGVDIEYCALNIRIALENLVLSTLVANRPAVAELSDAFASKTPANARRIVRRINPRYWPIPFKFRRSVDKDGKEYLHLDKPEEEFLREEEWGKAYGFCSTVLHAVNPYQYLKPAEPRGNQLNSCADELREYSRKIRALLWRHQIYLSETDVTLICRIPEDLTSRPIVEVYRKSRAGA